MKTRRIFCLVLMVVFVFAAFTEGAAKSTVNFNITFSTWVGYGPLFIARKKGFFEKYGVNPKLVIMEDESQFAPSVISGSVQAVAHVLDREIINYAKGSPVKVVMALDQSLGGDGIIASGDIKTVANLKGKTVALDKSTTSYFFFLSVLKKNGVPESSLTIKDMGASDAGTAFLAGNVDAAVVWEPWLTNSSKRKGGHTLVSSRNYPNTIVDTVVFNDKFIKSHPQAVKGFIKAWYDALDYYYKNVAAGNKMMADGLGISVKDIESEVGGVDFYDRKKNVAFFNPQKAGNIFEVAERASSFWVSKGVIAKKVAPTKFIVAGYLR